MGFKKSEQDLVDIRRFKEFDEARECFEDSNCNEEDRLNALDYILRHKEIYYVLRMMSKLFSENRVEDHVYVDYAFSNFKSKPKREEDFDELFKMMGSQNAYLRNATIVFLQEFGVEAKPFVEKLLNSEDRDIRIFAVNILGDVKYEDSIDMLKFFILKEKDINAMMTAVDYLGEIGSKDDISLLEALKKEHKDEPYVVFGIDAAIDRIRA